MSASTLLYIYVISKTKKSPSPLMAGQKEDGHAL